MHTVVLLLSFTLLAEPPQKADEPKEFEPALLKMKPLADDPKDDELHKLLKERFNAALAALKAVHQRLLRGLEVDESLFDAASRVKLAGLEAFENRKDQIALLEKYVELAKETEKYYAARFKIGKVSEEELYRVRYSRADAEIALLRLKGKPGEKPK